MLATHGWLVTQSGTGLSRKSTGVRQDLTSVAMATNRSCPVTQKYARGSRSQKKKERVSEKQAYHHPSLAPL